MFLGQAASITTTLAQLSKYWGENSFTNAKATKLSTVWVDSHNMLPKVSFLRTDVVILGLEGRRVVAQEPQSERLRVL